MYLSNKTNMASRSHRNALGDLDPPPEVLEEVAELVKRIEACLRETPFDDLVDRLTNRDDDLGFPAGGGVPINVIPGAHKLACTALTLALAKGISAGSRLGFPNVMRTVSASPKPWCFSPTLGARGTPKSTCEIFTPTPARAGTLSLIWSRAIESIALSGRCNHAFDDEADNPMTLVRWRRRASKATRSSRGLA